MGPKDILVSALRLLDEAEIPEDLRAVAFGKAVELLSGRNGTGEDRATLPHEGNSPPLSVARGASGLQLIAKKLGIEADVISDVYNVTAEGNLEIIVGASKLEKGKASGTKDIATLVAAGRQAAGIEEWTQVDTIRDVCEQFKRLDSPNFAATIKEMGNDVFSIRTPQDTRKREVRMTRPGWDKASALVRRVTNRE